MGKAMTNSLSNTVQQDKEAPCALFEEPLRVMSRRAVKVWFNHQRLDRILSEAIVKVPYCDLIYAIDTNGRQVSSNIYRDSIDRSTYGQDLSRRPYSVPTSVLNNAAFQGAFLCDAYMSQVTQRACLTVMYGVTSGPTTLGFIAADIDPQNLPAV